MATNKGSSQNLDMLNISNTMLSMRDSFALQNTVFSLPFYNGKNLPLKDFIQDVRNGRVHLSEEQKLSYIKAVLGRLQGSAHDSTYGLTFDKIKDLLKHLKTRFAPGKNFSYYINKNLRMRTGETVGDFYDHLRILLSGARSALVDETHTTQESQINIMMQPLTITALNVFLKGLPAEIARYMYSVQNLRPWEKLLMKPLKLNLP